MKKKITIITTLIIVILIIIVLYALYHLNYIEHKKYTNKDFNIMTYKSKYYTTGYPDDEYGVCTDVVAFALKDAGYDLMELVNEDIKANKDLYNIDNIDKKIDFRRVQNLKIYLDNNAISLTTDINKIDKWQGGDIVVFKKHIGIVSDNRNKKGITFIIHHVKPYQRYYEEDILEYRDDIIGHYRVS